MADPVTLAIGAIAVGSAVKAVSQVKQAKTQAKQVKALATAQAQDTVQQATVIEQTAQQPEAQAQASLYNAELGRQNAVLTRQKSAEEERRYRIQAASELGDIRARYGASGITLDGSAMDVLEESAANAELNALTVRHEGEIQALAYEQAATLDEFNAANAKASAGNIRQNAAYVRGTAPRIDAAGKQAAKDITTGGYLEAGGTLLSGASSAASLRLGSTSPGAAAQPKYDRGWFSARKGSR